MSKKIDLIRELYPLNRLLVGDDNDKALGIIKRELPEMNIVKIHSGTECWTWIVPEKWVVREAYLSDGKERIIDFADNPLHLLSYSLPVDKWVSKAELMRHLYYAEEHLADGGYTVPERPDAIPWRLKYYERDWGLCMEKTKFSRLTADRYYVKIDTEFVPGHLCIGDYTIPGETEDMIVIISDICHPAQVNDSISGAVVAIDNAKYLSGKNNYYTYKFLFLPESIGSVAYLSKHEHLIPKMKYGIFADCLGHHNSFALQYSYQGNTKIDRVAEYVLRQKTDNHRSGKYREIVCNDELYFNGPGAGIPTISLSRYPFPELHTSDDTPDIIDENMLNEAEAVIREILRIMDCDFVPRRKFKGMPFLSRYGLWVDWRANASNKKLSENIEKVCFMLEGRLSAFDISDRLGIDFDIVVNFLNKLYEHNLIEKTRDNEDGK